MKVLIVLCMKYFLFESIINYLGFDRFFPSEFNLTQVLLLCLSIVLIGAGGYIVNDIEDLEADRVNKNRKLIDEFMSIKWATALYITLTLLGIGVGYLLARQVELPALGIIHVICAALLWLYAKYFKSSILVGNILVSLLIALVPLCYFAFETISYLNSYKVALSMTYNNIYAGGPLQWFLNYTLILAVFAFLFNLLREIVKDAEDLEGDLKLEGKTLPMSIGLNATNWVAKGLLLVTFLALLTLYYGQLQFEPFSSFSFHSYLHVCITLPIVYTFVLLFKSNVDYKKVSAIIKFTMLCGVLTTYIFHSVVL